MTYLTRLAEMSGRCWFFIVTVALAGLDPDPSLFVPWDKPRRSLHAVAVDHCASPQATRHVRARCACVSGSSLHS